jgi:hypothetical protein
MNQVNYPLVDDVLLGLVLANPSIAALQFATLEFAPNLDKRAKLGDGDLVVVSQALELRSSLHLPFWDGIMLSAGNLEHVPVGALRAAAFHQGLEGKLKRITSKELTRARLTEETTNAAAAGRLLAVTSLVEMEDGSFKHLPMLDFHIGYSDSATKLVVEVIKSLESSGTLLKSGKSYHFYGGSLLSARELQAFLGRALLYTPIIDRAWTAHQIIEGRCALRISPRPEYGGAPSILTAID